MLDLVAVPSSVTPHSDLAEDLRMRMRGPQRYRLLQGYPMPQLMPRCGGGQDLLKSINLDPTRPLIVGVLPHTSCAPALSGCGFCTFPHEQYRASQVRRTVAAVRREIPMIGPELLKRRVEALYFGGGTANLTPADSLEALCCALAESLSLEDAEVTLEGAPVFFGARDGQILEVMRRSLPTERLRISLGIQTFDEEQLRSMGRHHFGTFATIAEVVRMAQGRGFATSGDFLINLPGQTPAQMRRDARRAVDIGLDQICLYHLVLFRGLATPWGRDPERLANRPDQATAEANWREIRQFLLDQGYVQTDLTNFERAQAHHSRRRYLYEDCSFHPETYDALGLGPAALSTFSDLPGQMGVKTMNEPSGQEYARRLEQGQSPRERHFLYGLIDLKLLFLTRRLSRLSVPRQAYAQAYGSDPAQDFPEEMAALQEAGLIEVDPQELWLTVKGMFYADSVAGLLASRRVRQLRLGQVAWDPNDPKHFPMG